MAQQKRKKVLCTNGKRVKTCIQSSVLIRQFEMQYLGPLISTIFYSAVEARGVS
jgi:hypothetical protein